MIFANTCTNEPHLQTIGLDRKDTPTPDSAIRLGNVLGHFGDFVLKIIAQKVTKFLSKISFN